jgi:hypothetical protein
MSWRPYEFWERVRAAFRRSASAVTPAFGTSAAVGRDAGRNGRVARAVTTFAAFLSPRRNPSAVLLDQEVVGDPAACGRNHPRRPSGETAQTSHPRMHGRLVPTHAAARLQTPQRDFAVARGSRVSRICRPCGGPRRSKCVHSASNLPRCGRECFRPAAADGEEAHWCRDVEQPAHSSVVRQSSGCAAARPLLILVPSGAPGSARIDRPSAVAGNSRATRKRSPQSMRVQTSAMGKVSGRSRKAVPVGTAALRQPPAGWCSILAHALLRRTARPTHEGR